MVSRDLGAAGPKDGEPIVVDWWSTRSLLSAAVWLLLIPLFLLRSNRERRALWVLLPPLAVQALISAVGMALPAQLSTAFVPFLSMASSLALGLAAVWLLGDVLATLPRPAAFASALVTMSVLGGVQSVANNPGPQEAWYAVANAVMSLIMLLALLAAAHGCRQRYSPMRFSALLVLACLLLSALASACTALIGAISVMGRSFEIAMVAAMLMGCLMSAAVVGIALSAVLLLFMALVYRTSFYGERFANVFGLCSTSAETDMGTQESQEEAT